MSAAKYDIEIGMRFGRLTVSEYVDMHLGRKRWRCECDCGGFTLTNGSRLKSGGCHSCGCLVSERMTLLNNKHGLSKTPEYSVWHDINHRCYDAKNKGYGSYGGRGIAVCDEWRDFEPFFEWSRLSGYKKGLTIDRIDNNGNYEPSNCKWSTMKEQANNTRRNRFVEIDGVSKTIAQWADSSGVLYATLKNRVNSGRIGIDLIHIGRLGRRRK